jgi:hypothetical protein
MTAKKTLLIGTMALAAAIPCGAKDKREGGSGFAVEVRVFDLAHVPPQLLEEAEWKASRIFRMAGVTLTWKSGSPLDEEGHQVEYRAAPVGGGPVPLACGDTDICELDVRLLGDTSRLKSAALAESLPFARYGIRVNVFYDRVRIVMDKQGSLAAPAILGHVLAHEIGHVLLGTNTHARAGLMRASWSDTEFARMAYVNMMFDRADIRRIQESLRMRRSIAGQQVAALSYKAKAIASGKE